MLNLNANMEGLFHVKHESKNLETRKIHKRKKNHHSFIVLKIKKTKSRIFTQNMSQMILNKLNAFRL